MQASRTLKWCTGRGIKRAFTLHAYFRNRFASDAMQLLLCNVQGLISAACQDNPSIWWPKCMQCLWFVQPGNMDCMHSVFLSVLIPGNPLNGLFSRSFSCHVRSIWAFVYLRFMSHLYISAAPHCAFFSLPHHYITSALILCMQIICLHTVGPTEDLVLVQCITVRFVLIVFWALRISPGWVGDIISCSVPLVCERVCMCAFFNRL